MWAPVRLPRVKRTTYCIRASLTALRACREREKTRYVAASGCVGRPDTR